MAGKSKTEGMIYSDVPGQIRRIWTAKPVGQTWTQHIRSRLRNIKRGLRDLVALEYITGVLDSRKVSPQIAVTLLRAIALADGMLGETTDLPEYYLAAAVCQMDTSRRAVLYYDCCSALGYDPVEAGDPHGILT